MKSDLMRAALFVVPAVLTAQGATPAHATDAASGETQFVIELGAGVGIEPKYPGADDYILSPFPIISIGRFYVPGLGQVVDGEVVMRGFDFYPAFNFNGERKASDSADLTGTNTVDWALELGLGAGYRYDWVRGFAEMRQGINGHDGQVVELGVDVMLDVSEHVEFAIGPRASWGSSEYMQTYFGVSAAEAAVPGSRLSAFNPGAGFSSVGVEATATYALTDRTDLHLTGGWDRFVGDAADSPIVALGDKNQFSVSTGISYRFAFDLFD